MAQYIKKNKFENKIKQKKKVLKPYDNETDPLDASGFYSIHSLGLFKMKNNPEYVVIIEVMSDKVSKSFNSNVLNGYFLKFIIKNSIRIKNIIKAYDVTPKLLIKIALKIILIFLYIITMSQK